MLEVNILDPCESRTVKPRAPSKPTARPIYAIDPGITFPDGSVKTVVLTELGATPSFEDYTRTLLHLPPHIVVTFSPETWLWRLHEYWGDHPTWTWRVVRTNSTGKPLAKNRIAYYGFKAPEGKGKSQGCYHLVLDAGSFFRNKTADANDLLELGVNIRQFCNAHGLDIRPSAAGIATQLLRHPAFYPFARRRVPNFINEAVRPFLPGGHYEAYRDAGQRLETAYYIDQRSAFHYAAQSTPLPNANSVRAIGYTRSERKYARKGGDLYRRELRNHGLLKMKVRVPWLPPQRVRFAPPLMRKPGYRIAYVWTNELAYLESLGLEVRYLIGVWGTEEVDKGLAKYATWAREVGERYPAFKALLLMPYGMLARHRGVSTFHHPGNGHDPLILANQLLSDTRAHTIPTQPETANALQLGLIQAFVRSLSLDMARQLSTHNHEVISIYADGIFVRLAEGKQVPMFAPWRVKGERALDLEESLNVPVRKRVRRNYLHTDVVKGIN